MRFGVNITYDEFIGKEKLQKLESLIMKKIPVILYGAPGTGKTTSVYLVAERLGYRVVEFNASDERSKNDLEKILRDVQMKSLVHKIYLFDEADGLIWWGIIYKIIKNSKYPIVFTANELHKIPQFIKDNCETIPYYPPDKRELVKLLRKKFGDKIKFDKVSDDVRNTFISVIYNSEPYETIDFFKELENIFKGKGFTQWNDIIWIWIIDNIDRIFEGKELFEKIKFVANLSLYNFPEGLKGLNANTHKRLHFVYPYFFERMKAKKENQGAKRSR